MVLIRVKQQTRGTELTDGQWEIGWKIETKFLRPQEATRVKTVCQLNVNHLSVYFLLSVLYDTFLLQLLLHLLLMYPLGLYLCLFMLESYDPSTSALSLSLFLSTSYYVSLILVSSLFVTATSGQVVKASGPLVHVVNEWTDGRMDRVGKPPPCTLLLSKGGGAKAAGFLPPQVVILKDILGNFLFSTPAFECRRC